MGWLRNCKFGGEGRIPAKSGLAIYPNTEGILIKHDEGYGDDLQKWLIEGWLEQMVAVWSSADLVIWWRPACKLYQILIKQGVQENLTSLT